MATYDSELEPFVKKYISAKRLLLKLRWGVEWDGNA